MQCPECGYAYAQVRNSRKTAPDKVYRRRVCRKCGYRFSTIEISKNTFLYYQQLEEAVARLQLLFPFDFTPPPSEKKEEII